MFEIACFLYKHYIHKKQFFTKKFAGMLFTNNIHLFTFLQLYLFVDLGFRKNMPDKEIAIILAGNLFRESKKKH